MAGLTGCQADQGVTASSSPLPTGWQRPRAALGRLDNLSAACVPSWALHSTLSTPRPAEHPLPFLPLLSPASPSRSASPRPSPTGDHESRVGPSRHASCLSLRESARLKCPACGECGGPPSCWSWAGAHLFCPCSAGTARSLQGSRAWSLWRWQ